LGSSTARHPGETKTKAVEAAIADHVRRGAVDWLLENAGKIEIEDVSPELRAIDRRVWTRVVLPDTSVWVDFSRRGERGRAAQLAELLDTGEVATCGPVAAELLAGAEGDVAARMWEMLDSLPWAQLDRAGGGPARARGGRGGPGGQTLPLTDVAIAVAAARAGYALWGIDTDFDCIAGALDALELYESTSRGGPAWVRMTDHSILGGCELASGEGASCAAEG
jgi:predicted nucleic acid-binding protein